MVKNWRTTLIAGVLAAVLAIQPLFEAGSYDYKKLIVPALIAFLGVVMKDAKQD